MFWRNALFFLWGFLRIQSWLMQLSFHLFDIYFAHSYYFGPLEDQNVWQLIRTDVWWSQAQYSTPPVLRGAVANWYANQDVKSPACSPLIPAQTTDLLALINRYVCCVSDAIIQSDLHKTLEIVQITLNMVMKWCIFNNDSCVLEFSWCGRAVICPQSQSDSRHRDMDTLHLYLTNSY